MAHPSTSLQRLCHPVRTWASDRHGAEMMRTDLASDDVAYQDARGRYADFHSLRHTFISNLARAGLP